MNVLLGVSGSVSAYRAADLARDLGRAGAVVNAVLTASAQRFVTRDLFEALTGRPSPADTFDEPERGRMVHIDLARQADVIVLAPASADLLARLAHGRADDLLSTLVLASSAPVLIAPAMNPQMWAADATRENVQILLNRGFEIVGPTGGLVACGEEGTGKLSSNSEIVDAALALVAHRQRLRGKRVLVTTGPTEEPLDDVRVLTNRSSGKMGSAVVRAALAMGAEVDVVAGPQREPLPPGARIVRVQTAQEMYRAAVELAEGVDLAIGVAAVADYRPAARAEGKQRSGKEWSLEMVPNPDVIAAIASRAKRTVGFAAEPTPDLEHAREKYARKGLWAIAHNDISAPGVGFDYDTSALTLITDSSVETSGMMSKRALAKWLLERVAPDAPA